MKRKLDLQPIIPVKAVEAGSGGRVSNRAKKGMLPLGTLMVKMIHPTTGVESLLPCSDLMYYRCKGFLLPWEKKLYGDSVQEESVSQPTKIKAARGNRSGRKERLLEERLIATLGGVCLGCGHKNMKVLGVAGPAIDELEGRPPWGLFRAVLRGDREPDGLAPFCLNCRTITKCGD